MPRAPVADRLRHILDAVARVETLTLGKSFEDYAADWVTRDAVERNLERVSEASRHVPSDLKSQHKNVPWRAVAGLGNVLRHDYPRVKDPRVWRIVSHDLAPLKAAVRGDAAGDRRQRARGLSRLGNARSLPGEGNPRDSEASGSFGLRGGLGSFVRIVVCELGCLRALSSFGRGEARVRSDGVRHRFRRPGSDRTPRSARDRTCAGHGALLSLNVHGKGGHTAAGGIQCSRLWEFIQRVRVRGGIGDLLSAASPGRYRGDLDFRFRAILGRLYWKLRAVGSEADMSERLNVMISSTARDLPAHREQVRLACERAGFAPHDMMEHLPALNADAVVASLEMVKNADVYLGIFAYRYGYLPDGSEISITEMEYNRAVKLKKPRLIFFIHEDHPVTVKDFETGDCAQKLQALKDRIGKKRVAAYFKSPEDLRGHVVEALVRLRRDLEAGEPEDAKTTAAKFHRRTAIPAPPEPYVAHPYTLLQVHDLIGRRAELNLLTDWIANPAAKAFGARIFGFVAIGGMGKSALTWKWFQQIAPEEMKPLAGRLWWSFYESDASFENFVSRALSYASQQSEDEVRALRWPEREAELLRHLDERPFLFVLDGLERILIAYHWMNASYVADTEYDEQTANRVAGAAGLPASAAESFIGQHRLRQTIDPRAGAFLQRLTQVRASRLLISTQLYPSELQTRTGDALPGCFAYFLRGLSDDDALGLWRALGVKGSRQELVPIFRSVEGHPLLVQALASEVANYRKAPGDFARWRADHPQFDPTSLPLVQSRTHILQYALKGLDDDVLEVLRTLVAFRMPATYDTLEALLVGTDKTYRSSQELDRALTELEDRGLIGWDREANRYDAHPIVRGVVWQQTTSKDQQAVYTALEAHLEPMATPGWRSVKSLEDLTPAIERYHTLVELGRYDDAFRLFRDRLDYATLRRLAAHRERIAWLERLFPEGVEGLPALTDKGYQAFTLNALGASYRGFGQPGRSVPLRRRNIELRQRSGSKESQQIGLSNLAVTLMRCRGIARGSRRATAGAGAEPRIGKRIPGGGQLSGIGSCAQRGGSPRVGAGRAQKEPPYLGRARKCAGGRLLQRVSRRAAAVASATFPEPAILLTGHGS